MFLFNNQHFSNPGGYTEMRDEVLLTFINKIDSDRLPYVEILSYCLMTNHFHLLLKQLVPDGIPIFLHKLSMGYSKYFNLRHKRTGTLYEGRYKAKLAEHEGHFEHLPKYIHLNVLDLFGASWPGPEENWQKVVQSLESYRWSSHHVYAGREEELNVVNKNEARKLFPQPEDYWHYLKDGPKT